ncbi:MAG: sulfurtransferase [Armatimonadetes bacterium]|nr:sulfurtransferase [Armatimonadota bacterium]
MNIPSTTPAEVNEMIQEGRAPFLLDCREAHELEICKITGSHHIPMNQIQARISEVPRDQTVVVLCRSGARSASVTEYLVQNGFDAMNLHGGILRWGQEIDPTMDAY